MKPIFTAFAVACALTLPAGAADAPKPILEEVAAFPDKQVTGVAVSKEGRVFVNFPFWSDKHTVSVAEVIDGKLRPFPDGSWNQKDGAPDKRWVCVQSVYVDAENTLWILDPASPKMEGVVKGGPKLVKFDLASNSVTDVILFDDTIAPKDSYLNDVRVDTQSGHAFITDSGAKALVVVDLKSKKARRVLANHVSTTAEKIDLVVDGIKLIDPKTKGTPQIHADGIALHEGTLFYRPMTGRSVYKISTDALKDASLSPEELAAKVVKLTETPASDGMLAGEDGKIYSAAFEKNAIICFHPETGKAETVMQDDLLQWPDSMSWGADGELYVTTSQIHRTAKFNEGQSKLKGPFMVYRIRGL